MRWIGSPACLAVLIAAAPVTLRPHQMQAVERVLQALRIPAGGRMPEHGLRTLTNVHYRNNLGIRQEKV